MARSSGGDPHLAVGRADVGLDGVDAEVHQLGQLGVGLALRDEGDDLGLAVGEAFGATGPIEPGVHAGSWWRIADDDLAGRDGLDGGDRRHCIANGVTPAMVTPQVGAGSVYVYTVHDANATYSTAPAPTVCTSNPTLQRRTSWPSTFTTRPDPFAAPGALDDVAVGGQQLPDDSYRTTTAPTTSTSGAPPGRAASRTGSRPFPASRGSCSSGSTDRLSRGATRRGSSTSSNPSTDPPRRLSPASWQLGPADARPTVAG